MLLVAPTTAASFYDTQEIIYSRRAGERAYYQLSSWTEPPNRGLATLLAARLALGGAFRGAVETGERRARRPAAAHPPASSSTTMPSRRRARRGSTLERGAERSRPAAACSPSAASAPRCRSPRYDAAGAVQGFGQALGPLLDEVAAWAAQAAAGAR